MAKKKADVLEIHKVDGKSEDALMAATMTRPSVQPALTIGRASSSDNVKLGLTELAEELQEQMKAVSKGDLSRGEAMLTAQAHMLDALFNKLSRMALAAEYVSQLESYMRLALKAQNQARTTWEAISRIQHPTVSYFNQANIAHNQQINNGSPQEIQKSPNELLEHEEHERLDIGTTIAPIAADQEVETVEEVDGAKDRQRKKGL